jgi:hypothetical protein
VTSAVFTTVVTEEQSATLEDIVSLPAPCSFKQLSGLRLASLPHLSFVMDEIRARTGLVSERNLKTHAAARAKLKRPGTVQRYPWIEARHLRDFLRFRTSLRRLEDFTAVAQVFAELQTEGQISVVKMDYAKLLNPGEFGWRMIATDIRLKSGLLVEHYMTFGDLIHVNQDWLHKVYERWRNAEVQTLGQARARLRDATFSTVAYREMFIEQACASVAALKDINDARAAGTKAFVGQLAADLGL